MGAMASQMTSLTIVYSNVYSGADQSTGGNRTMVTAATIVSMAAADGERISIFPLVCPNKARCVSFSAPDI